MDRKAIAAETLEIMRQGYYIYEGKRVEIASAMMDSVERSRLITPERGAELLKKYETTAQEAEAAGGADRSGISSRVENLSTVDAIWKLAAERKERIGVLNFASAKNPGGGFLNGAMAQEESLAASGTLYRTLTAHEEYYRTNRSTASMMYTDYAIYSPDVVFFRDGEFRLTEEFTTASVLTLPAVNMGQVILKGENIHEAARVMEHRMKLALAIFAEQGARNLILGAYGCGVFRNDPVQVAAWWKKLLAGEGMGARFESVFYAVLDRSKSRGCITAFERCF